MLKLICSVVVSVLLFWAGQARAEVLLADNFDGYSYDNLAAFHAAWTPSGSSGGVSLTGGTNKIATVPGSQALRSQRSFGEFMPTAQADLEISFKIGELGMGAARQYIELMDGDGSASGQLLQLGITDSPVTDEWAVRMLGSIEADSLVPMDPAAPDRGQTVELKAVIRRETDTTASAKIYVNDVLGKSLSGFALRSYDTVRIGSNLVTGNFIGFDDVLVQTVAVPEPATGAGLGAALVLFGRRHRSRRIP